MVSKWSVTNSITMAASIVRLRNNWKILSIYETIMFASLVKLHSFISPIALWLNEEGNVDMLIRQ